MTPGRDRTRGWRRSAPAAPAPPADAPGLGRFESRLRRRPGPAPRGGRGLGAMGGGVWGCAGDVEASPRSDDPGGRGEKSPEGLGRPPGLGAAMAPGGGGLGAGGAPGTGGRGAGVGLGAPRLGIGGRGEPKLGMGRAIPGSGGLGAGGCTGAGGGVVALGCTAAAGFSGGDSTTGSGALATGATGSAGAGSAEAGSGSGAGSALGALGETNGRTALGGAGMAGREGAAGAAGAAAFLPPDLTNWTRMSRCSGSMLLSWFFTSQP